MPQREERFFWLYGKALTDTATASVEQAVTDFASRWKECAVAVSCCVSAAASPHRLWLFRVRVGLDQGTATRFNKALDARIRDLHRELGVSVAALRRRSNLPTPLVMSRLTQWPRTDLGLHSVNDQYNAMLVTFSYHEGPGRQYPPHLQLNVMQDMVTTVREAWARVACDCRQSVCENCAGAGCYGCFASGCSRCDGTGRKDFTEWSAAGFKIDYGDGFPMAAF